MNAAGGVRRLVAVLAAGFALMLLLPVASNAQGQPEHPPAASPRRTGFPLIFDSERIQIAVAGESLEIRGTYYLVCPEPVDSSLPLFYPFPRDSMMGGARMISLTFRCGTGAPATGRWEARPAGSGVRWWLPPCAADTIVAESVYRQKTDEGYGRYIVTTTRPWGRPLRKARFEVRLPDGAVPVEWSFPFEPTGPSDSPVYVYEARSFFPDHDIVFRWRR